MSWVIVVVWLLALLILVAIVLVVLWPEKILNWLKVKARRTWCVMFTVLTLGYGGHCWITLSKNRQLCTFCTKIRHDD